MSCAGIPELNPIPPTSSPSTITGNPPPTTNSLPPIAELKRSTVFTGPRSSIGEDRGETSKAWSSPLWNGSTGSTTVAFWSPSATYRQPKPKNDIAPCRTHRPWPHNLNEIASGKLGPVQKRPLQARWLTSLRKWGRLRFECNALQASLSGQNSLRPAEFRIHSQRV
jgi:hypothetical protein